ncbi:hypothetical protein K0U83_10840 [bacterium]|nr:hypothetical protein [bacterium]
MSERDPAEKSIHVFGRNASGGHNVGITRGNSVANLAGYVRRAIHELERALHDRVHEEAASGVPADVVLSTELAQCSPWFTRTLLAHLPTLAEPWRIVDMRDGEPTKIVRDGCRDVIASVRRVGQGKRGRPRWTAVVGDTVVSPPDVDERGDALPIDWSTREEAQAACDAQLRESGVVIVDEVQR